MVKSRGEIISNAIINGIGLPISIVMMVLLIFHSSNILSLLFSIFISVGILTTSIFKTLYYSFDSNLFIFHLLLQLLYYFYIYVFQM